MKLGTVAYHGGPHDGREDACPGPHWPPQIEIAWQSRVTIYLAGPWTPDMQVAPVVRRVYQFAGWKTAGTAGVKHA